MRIKASFFVVVVVVVAPPAVGVTMHRESISVLDLAEELWETFPSCYTAQKNEFILPLWSFHQNVGAKRLLNFRSSTDNIIFLLQDSPSMNTETVPTQLHI